MEDGRDYSQNSVTDLFTKHGRKASEGAEDAILSNESKNACDDILFSPALIADHFDACLLHRALPW